MTGPLRLTPAEEAMAAGADGPAVATAMRLVLALARMSRAERLQKVAGARIDACLFHGQAGLDVAERLVADGGRVRVPTTLNVSSLDLLHPDRYRGDASTAQSARRLMQAYVALGAEPTWTCAPYQLAARPRLGEHVAWAESNAIIFANSVLGARTGRYGDFIDIAAAITGRVPLAGLHLDEPRRGRVVFDVSSLPARLMQEDTTWALLGLVVGARTGSLVPVVTGAPRLTEDNLKALGAAAASTGAVAMLHVVGSTPEAGTLERALQGRDPDRVEQVSAAGLLAARQSLATRTAGPLVGVNLGTPHFSVAEFAQLRERLAGRRLHPDVDVHVSTGRGVLAQVRQHGWLEELESAGVRMVTDTCTYVTPVLRARDGLVLTSSAKWAYYAPGNIGVDVAFASLGECVESAVAGRVVTDPDLWAGVAAAQAPSVPATRQAGAGAGTRVLHAGTASGPALVLDAPLSFWGGIDPHTGRVVDVHHPQAGVDTAGTVLVLPSARGSSSSSSVLAEALRGGTAPAALLLGEADEILVLGTVAAQEVYGRSCPVLEIGPAAVATLHTGDRVRVSADGWTRDGA